MKNLTLAILLCGSTLFLACNEEERKDNKPEPTALKLTGTWLLQSFSENGTPIVLDECEKLETLVFNPDNTVNFTYYGDKKAGKSCELSVVGTGIWKFVSDKMIELDYSTDEYKDVFRVDYEIEGEQLTLIIHEENASYKERYIKQ